jgi:flagellin
MGLIINHNMMAMRAARNLSTVYSALNTSMTRLSSGLRINSAADDAAGLAIRELMRADIMVLGQGLRNASDGISMIQTAEGALSVVDEKLIRMKELAEQAATGTYTTVQRDLMNSEYQAMASEIDRIANATDFNGVNMLNGDMELINDGSGMKIHFGVGNDESQDYYFVTIGDVRATSLTGLQIGGGAIAEVWTNTNAVSSLSTIVGSATTEPDHLTLWYNAPGDSSIPDNAASAMAAAPENLVGIYEATSATTLQDLVDAVNEGTAARIQLDFDDATVVGMAGSSALSSAHTLIIGNTTVYFNETSAAGANNVYFNNTLGGTAASAFVTAFNTYSNADTFAVVKDDDSVILFAKDAGTAGNSIAFAEAGNMDKFNWLDLENNAVLADIGAFSRGGLDWITADAEQNAVTGNYAMTLTGAVGGDNYDIWTMDPDDILGAGATTWSGPLANFGTELDGDWAQLEGYRPWDGADILTQSAAQVALAQLDLAIEIKDKTRAGLGALQNRLENTIAVMAIQAENLQAAESRISDIDVALEMTQFTKNMIMAQAATAMLAQANGLAQLALTVLG